MGDFPCPACCFLFQYQSPRALDLHGFQGPGASSYRAAPGRGAGLGPAQGGPCGVGSRPVPGGGAVGYCVPFGWSGLFRCLGAQRPGGPAYPAGVPISPEKWGERGPGASPLDPRFYGRSFPLAGFGVVGRSGAVVGLFRGPCTCPDLDSHFAGAGGGCESILLRGCTTHEGFPLGGSCHRR